MKSLYIAAAMLIVAALFFGVGTATTHRSDGTWWSEIPASAQGLVVTGMHTGYDNGWTNGVAHEANQINAALASNIATKDKSNTIHAVIMSVVSREKGPGFSRAEGYYVSAISSFYATHPSAHALGAGAVFGCLQDQPMISCDQLAKWAQHHASP